MTDKLKLYSYDFSCNMGHPDAIFTQSGKCIDCLAEAAHAERERKKGIAKQRAIFASLKRSIAQAKATPKWLSDQHILDFATIYSECRFMSRHGHTTYEVDHIVPIQHPEVCGLHVPWNLRIVPQYMNSQKGNRFVVGTDGCSDEA